MECPFCGHDNIEGVDTCAQCEQPLTDMYLHDPATAVERGLLKDRIAALDPKPPIVVSPKTPVGEVLRTLVDKSIGCVIVVEGGKVVGIFSERDALRKLNIDADSLSDQPVADFMTTPVETLDAGAKVAFAVQRMDQGSYRHIPIVDDDDEPLGIISARDILRYLTERMTTAETS